MESLEVMVQGLIEYPETIKIEAAQDLLNSLSDFKMFYYTPKVDSNERTLNLGYRPLDLPFQNLWVELKNIAGLWEPNDNYWEILGFGVKELAPDHQRFYAIATRVIKDKLYLLPYFFSVMGDKLGVGSSPLEESYNFLCENTYKIASEVLSNTHNKTIHFADNNTSINVRGRIAGKFTKVKYYPKDVIYIGKKTEVKKALGTRKIINKPDYAYEVMGHWRKIDTLGKDRQGNRTVRGFTWVKAYTKGSGEVMRKVRIV